MRHSLIALAATLILAIAVALTAGSHPVHATVGLDLGAVLPTSTWVCLAKNYKFSIVNAYAHCGQINKNSPINLNNARVAGIAYNNIMMTPCPMTQNASQQVSDVVYANSPQFFGQLWFDVDSSVAQKCGGGGGGGVSCAWATTTGANAAQNQKKNCDFMASLIAAGRFQSVPLGVISSMQTWTTLFGDACTVGADAKLPLLYTGGGSAKSFDDFKKFGGWAAPAVKRIADGPTLQYCGVDGNTDFYP